MQFKSYLELELDTVDPAAAETVTGNNIDGSAIALPANALTPMVAFDASAPMIGLVEVRDLKEKL